MNTAETILEKIAGHTAVTFYGGYAMSLDKPRVLFEPAKVEKEIRNNKGRVTRGEYRYKDGSLLIFTWSDAQGPKFKVKGKSK